MSLSNDTKKVLVVAMANESKANEVSAAIDANESAASANAAKVAGSGYVIAGLLVATATDNTDAATLGFLVGDIVALIKDADQTLQTITTADEFASAPAIGDLIQHYRAV